MCEDQSVGSEIRTSEWTRRSCPICQRPDLLTELGRRTVVIRQRTRKFEWRQVDGICLRCGLIQSLREPLPEFLDEYYSDATTVRSTEPSAILTPGFDVSARLATIEKYYSGGLLVEIGAGDGTFCEILRRTGIDAVGIDPLQNPGSEAVKRGYGTQDTIGKGTAAVVVAYDVLEHAADPLAWLQAVSHLLKPAGAIIIEVPDVERWPVDAWHHEHFTQFTNGLLQTIHEQVGFETISCGVEDPSRHHGIVYVGRYAERESKEVRRGTETINPTIEQAIDLYNRADGIRREQQAAAGRTAKHIIQTAQRSGQACEIVVWGANEIATAIGYSLRMLDQHLPIRIVDNSDSKVGLPHEGFDRPIGSANFGEGSSANLIFVLCSRNWNRQIEQQIINTGVNPLLVIDGTDWPGV